MLTALLLIGGGVLLLYGGAEGLVRGSASVANRLGLTPLVIGLTVVAFGTSAPELVVSVGAALAGNGPIAVGNAVGSNISNVALILGLSALISPPRIHAQIVRLDIPVVVGVSLLMVFLLRDGQLARPEGLLLLAGLATYTVFSVRSAGSESSDGGEGAAAQWSVAADVAWVIGGLGLLIVGARMLVSGAMTVATALGLSQKVIGLTVVAVGTSLPELATSVLAASRRQGDIAVGNIVGSNIFNILGILGAASVVRPLRESGMSVIDLGVMVGFAMALLPLMRSGYRLSRWEGVGLLLGYGAYLFYLIA